MKNLLPTLAVLLLLPASVWAGAQDQLNNCANANDRSCWGAYASQPMADVDASGSSGQGASQLGAASPRQGSYKADINVPDAKPVKDHHRLGFLKKHAKMILGLAAAGGGAYFGFTHIAAFAGLGGPWGAAAMGAAAGLLLGMFIIPKIIGMFHHHKKKAD